MTLLSNKVFVYRLCAILAGGILPFAFSPYDIYVLVILSLTVLFFVWTKSSAKESFILGYLFGFALFGIGVNWLHISINLFGGVNFFGALFFTYLLVAYLALYPALCGFLAVRFFGKNLFIVLPILWVVTEWCRGWILTGFPWLNLGTSQTDSILASFAPIIGDYGLSLLVCISAVGLILLITGNLKRRVTGIIILTVIVSSSILAGHVNWTETNGAELNVALVQGAIPQKLKWKAEQREKTYEIYSGLSEPYWSSDLIIWPETAIPSLYHLADDFISRISDRKKNTDTLFMSGLAYKDLKTNQYYNSVLLIDREHHFYHKHHLVPFGEYLPFKSILGQLLRFLQIPMSDFSAGDEQQKLLKTKKGNFGMSICYEDAYGTEIRKALPDANILVNVSNDAWFGDSMAPHQHLQIARMRAMENGRYLLRSTNTGISAIIDNKGKVVSQSPQFVPDALHGRVKLFIGETPYSRYGNNLVLGFCFLTLILIRFVNRKNAY